MFKMNLYIFLLFININLIFSSSECESITTPSDSHNCTDKTNKAQTNPDYCCYYKSNNNAFCKTIPNSAFYQDYIHENINGVLYNITCNTNKKSSLLEQCGNSNPKDLGDCKKHSNVLNSCCFTKGNSEISKGCYWLGTKYDGDIKWAGVDMECNLNFLKYYLVNLIFIFLILF